MATQTANVKNGKTDSMASANGATPVADKVSETLHHSVDNLAQHAAKTEEKIRETASSSAESMKKNKIKVEKMWNESAVGKYTKEHPLASAGIAFAAGMLVTTLLKRK